MLNAEEILETVDSCNGVLPALANDGRIHLTDARMTVFRTNDHWAIFFEFIDFGDVYFNREVKGVGNCFEDDFTWAKELNSSQLFEEVPETPLWKRYPEHGYKGEWLADRAKFSIMLEGQQLDFTPTIEDYRAAGIDFRDNRTGPGSLEPGYLLRFLCYHLNHSFFASESALRSQLVKCPDALMFIQTKDWHHPIYLVNSWDEDTLFEEDHIRNIPCFQILARAIASGNLEEWDSQDSSAFNTHWESLEAIRRENL